MAAYGETRETGIAVHHLFDDCAYYIPDVRPKSNVAAPLPKGLQLHSLNFHGGVSVHDTLLHIQYTISAGNVKRYKEFFILTCVFRAL